MGHAEGARHIPLGTLPDHLDEMVAKLKLETMGVKIDKLSKDQQTYVRNWREGT